MKTCPVCSERYDDGVSVCPRDGEPLDAVTVAGSRTTAEPVDEETVVRPKQARPISSPRFTEVRLERPAPGVPTEPVGAVYAGDTGRAAMQAAQAAAAAAAASQVAYGGTTDGKTIFGNLCHACHETGAGGAPKITDKAAWAPRVAEGLDTLIKHATEGFTGKSGVMPPKGGNPALTDAQIKATVSWMVDQVK